MGQIRNHSTEFPPARVVAFTLLEVLIAMGIFFMAIFAILELTTRSLQAARSLQEIAPDAGSVASMLAILEELEEGGDGGDFADDPQYSWSSDTYEISTNGLFQVDIRVRSPGGEEELTSILLYRPSSVQSLGSRSRGRGRR